MKLEVHYGRGGIQRTTKSELGRFVAVLLESNPDGVSIFVKRAPKKAKS